MKIKLYISILIIACSSCSSLTKGTYVQQISIPEMDVREKLDSSLVQEMIIDSTLPIIYKDSSLTSVARMRALLQPFHELEFKRNRKCIYSVKYPGGGINYPSIIEKHGKYLIEEEYIVIEFYKSRAYKNKGWSTWKEIDKTLKLNYNTHLDSLSQNGEKEIFIKI